MLKKDPKERISAIKIDEYLALNFHIDKFDVTSTNEVIISEKELVKKE